MSSLSSPPPQRPKLSEIFGQPDGTSSPISVAQHSSDDADTLQSRHRVRSLITDEGRPAYATYSRSQGRELAQAYFAHVWGEIARGPRPSFTFALLGNANHVILRLTLSKLLREGYKPSFVLEDEGTAALQRKTAWYNAMYDSTQPIGAAPLPSVAELLKGTGIAHYTVANLNNDEAVGFMKQHDVQLYALANTRIVKEHVLAIPTVTSFNCHGAFLPSDAPEHQSPHPSGYIRGALVTMYALEDDAPLGLALHHVLPALDAGDIVATCPVPVSVGFCFADVITATVVSTANLWVAGFKAWDVSTAGVKQNEALLSEKNKICRRAPKTVEELDETVAKLELILQSGTYSWYTDRHGNYTTAATEPTTKPLAGSMASANSTSLTTGPSPHTCLNGDGYTTSASRGMRGIMLPMPQSVTTA